MTYNPTTGVWQSFGPVALIPHGGLPGGSNAAVRRWTAPAGGRVHITGNAHSLNPTGTQIPNNVVVSIRQGAQTLWQATLNSWDASGPTFDIATVVAPGNTIDFSIHQNHPGNVVDVDGVDATWFDPTLEFTPWAATLSASASQPAVGWAWGASGNLGDGSTPNRSTPGEVSALTQLVAVAAGGQ